MVALCYTEMLWEDLHFMMFKIDTCINFTLKIKTKINLKTNITISS